MTLEEFYAQVGGSLDEAKRRLYKEELIKKYLKMFPADESFSGLKAAVDAQDWKQVFAITHNLKGMAANLELTRLFEVSSNLCEDTRNGAPTGDAVAQYNAIASEYQNVINAIEQVG